ncbi:MAG: TAT-variant-translocated molybdopterin oxidoreductase [Bdellovibrionales bacterium]
MIDQNQQNPEKTEGASPKYWQSLDEWRNTDEFKELADKQFKVSPFAPEDSQSGFARREFLKLMGASMALTSAGCLRRPEQRIVPYANRPPEVVPGNSNFYSSSLVDGGEAFGLVVRTREGRPIKLEGNADHPINLGKLSARANAHLLSLYDPDRLTGPKHNLLNSEKTNRDTVNADYGDVDKLFADYAAKRQLAIITGTVLSPSTRELLGEFVRVTGSKHYTIDNMDMSALRLGQRASYGQDVLPRLRVDQANYILTLDTDLLGTFVSPVEYARQFASRRQPDGEMNKLVAFESHLSMTGANADERYRIKSSDQLTVVAGIIAELAKTGRVSREASDLAGRFQSRISEMNLPEGTLAKVAEELWNNRGKSLVVAGGLSTQTSGAVDLQVAVNYLNNVLGNDGRTIDYDRAPSLSFAGQNDVSEFVADANAGRIRAAVIWGTNPVYSQPEKSGFTAALKSLENVAYAGLYNDETGRVSNYLIPDHHQLENWGDLEGQSGTISIQQPTIRPLYNTRAFQETLLNWADVSGRASGILNSKNYYDYLRGYWRRKVQPNSVNIRGNGFEDFWYKVLQTGVVETQSSRDRSAGGRSFRNSRLNDIQPVPGAELELVTYPSVALGDGSLANIPWLQELPDPVSKIVWDNYASISPNFAHEQNLHEGDVVELTVNGVKRNLPVHIQPGQHDSTVAIAVGYGRQGAGKVADGIGVNVYDFATYANGSAQFSAQAVTLNKTSQRMKLASPQGHHRMEGRQIVVEATLDQYKNDPAANIHKHKVFSLWGKHEYKGHRWAMGVDLNACNGCGACTIACQAENNIPTVGKRYVIEGRIMQWIRIDRYYAGDPENPAVLNMPVMCQHCENAPCETVCPVNATVHGDEGTNDMIYNRCVGTRYCANNCPYKVRRFNWFNYVKNVKEPQHLALNPEVTVRDRGVMEKCTFCTHRIKEAKIKAKSEDRGLSDGDVVTACQQSCPTNAIIFGDINDANSKVSQHFNKGNTYALLEELNAVPMVKYATKIRNT